MAKQIRLGEFWLAWRTDRGEWAICWNDAAAGTRRRKSTGCRDYNDDTPPIEAQQALADHFAKEGTPEAIEPGSDNSVSRIMTAWLAKVGSKRARSAQYAYSVRHLQRWIDRRGSLTVRDVKPSVVQGFIDMRLKEEVSGTTIKADLAALKAALKWANDNEVIPYLPKVGNVEKELVSDARDIEYSQEQVAALLEAAASHIHWQHVIPFTMLMLSCHARVEAVLELDAGAQVRKGLIYFNAPGRKQTSKRRPIVPVAPSLAPWLPSSGKVIMYRVQRKDGTIYERPTFSIKNAFAGCLVEAGITDSDGNPWGSPNALRHTIHTYLQTVGVPQAQIDAAAGHVSDGGKTGKNYTHLRPEYLKEFVAAVENYWLEMDAFTSAHRSHVGPKLFDIKTGKAL